MDHSDTAAAAASIRRDGWTEARKTRFLEHLAQRGNVRAACTAVGMSHEAAYQLRRRDALVARAWAAALELAREASAQVLACRALDGIEEDVWHRGEVVGTRRRYDSRLLLAHMARLDAAVATGDASEDVERFDELLALVAGAQPPAELPLDPDGVPGDREACVESAGEEAEAASQREEAEAEEAGEVLQPEELRARHDRAVARYRRARARAAEQWDGWALEARATVDRLLAEPLAPAAAKVPAWTLSGASTSALAQAIVAGHPGTA